MPRPTQHPEITKLRADVARLTRDNTRLKDDLTQALKKPKYTSYDNLPPPSPEDRLRIRADLTKLLEKLPNQRRDAHNKWLLSIAHNWP